jgi:hypothetical protein
MRADRLQELLSKVTEVYPDAIVGIGMGYLVCENEQRQTLAKIKFVSHGGGKTVWYSPPLEHNCTADDNIGCPACKAEGAEERIPRSLGGLY